MYCAVCDPNCEDGDPMTFTGHHLPVSEPDDRRAWIAMLVAILLVCLIGCLATYGGIIPFLAALFGRN